jgi:hypothetical protein
MMLADWPRSARPVIGGPKAYSGARDPLKVDWRDI